MTWQIHDKDTHGTNEWQDMPGSHRDAEAVARLYLSDIDPREYDPSRGFDLLVRRSPDHGYEVVHVRIRPMAWLVNGKP